MCLQLTFQCAHAYFGDTPVKPPWVSWGRVMGRTGSSRAEGLGKCSGVDPARALEPDRQPEVLVLFLIT